MRITPASNSRDWSRSWVMIPPGMMPNRRSLARACVDEIPGPRFGAARAASTSSPRPPEPVASTASERTAGFDPVRPAPSDHRRGTAAARPPSYRVGPLGRSPLGRSPSGAWPDPAPHVGRASLPSSRRPRDPPARSGPAPGEARQAAPGRDPSTSPCPPGTATPRHASVPAPRPRARNEEDPSVPPPRSGDLRGIVAG